MRYDGFSYGAIHNAVRDHIYYKYFPDLSKETTIHYKNGKIGRADLTRRIGNQMYIWEIKPLSYAFSSKLFLAVNQISTNVESHSGYRYGNRTS